MGAFHQLRVKAFASLLGRIRVSVQQSESGRLVWDDRAPIGAGGEFALCKARGAKRFHAFIRPK